LTVEDWIAAQRNKETLYCFYFPYVTDFAVRKSRCVENRGGRRCMATELKQTIESVMDLQHQWTAVKTPAMDSRGELIRDTIPRLLRPLADGRNHEVSGS
jgi:hypothetical protein